MCTRDACAKCEKTRTSLEGLLCFIDATLRPTGLTFQHQLTLPGPEHSRAPETRTGRADCPRLSIRPTCILHWCTFDTDRQTHAHTHALTFIEETPLYINVDGQNQQFVFLKPIFFFAKPSLFLKYLQSCTCRRVFACSLRMVLPVVKVPCKFQQQLLLFVHSATNSELSSVLHLSVEFLRVQVASPL